MTRHHFGAELFPDRLGIDDPEFKSFMSKITSKPEVLPSAPRAVGPLAQVIGPAGAAIEGAATVLARSHGEPPGKNSTLGDRPSNQADTHIMSDITREELNAKLETIEVKMDARVSAISTKIDGFLAAQAERDRRLDESIAGVRRDLDRLGSLKLNIWGAMATALTVGIAITALSLTFYQTGKAESASASATPPAISQPASTQPKN